MSLRTTSNRPSTRTSRARTTPPTGLRRRSLYLAVAAAGAVAVGLVTGTDAEPAAQAVPVQPVSIADQLGIAAADPSVPVAERLAPLEQLAASRGERQAQRSAAAEAQRAADEAARKKAAEEAARKKAAEEAARKKAAEEAARKEAAEQAAREAAAQEAAREAAAQEAARAAEAASRAPAAAPAPAAAAPSGSYQGYALSKLGGDSGQFSCLESLWGKESGWNPNAQNPTSSAYGIAQFLDSTWAGTGVAKTSDGYRQIDAGLIYINNRYGSPCGAWNHSQRMNWY